eukprot:Plantae.Rhodophyta-Palmaria_palmata.ctg8040.p2 GENE.Plantae.Rhodophyta-Palmaria_palmata.ctg8040~~Plantae.Rhodophyta-Palmaria_palmata.ctg8040.p2  ORF type:complete len:100 (-),score=2.51 Plantae.Rhodophyta-Palmaria_palmata.ctg8040:1-300(-)
MKSKSEASNTIDKALVRLQLIFGRKVERLHTDNAPEQNTRQIKDFLDRQGTLRTLTASASSPSNSVVERRFEAIFSAARKALKKHHHQSMVRPTGRSPP